MLSRFKQAKFRHVELAGFYWVTEETSAKSPLIGNIVDYCAQKRYDLYWIPYFHAPGFESWKEKGFARAYYQPNHFFHNEIPYERLKVACAEAQANGMDMEVEFDESALKKHGRGGRLRDYMRAFRETGVWERCKLAYYQGGRRSGTLPGFLRLRVEAPLPHAAERRKTLTDSPTPNEH